MITKITQEHLDWWDNLPPLWQRIFVNMLYYPELNIGSNYWYRTANIDEYQPSFVIDNNDWNGKDVLRVDNTLRSPDDLLRLFQFKAIGYNAYITSPAYLWVKEIPPLHYFTELKVLDLAYNWVRDLSGLKAMTQLEVLILHENSSVEDISPLADLTNLKELDLWGNNVKNISPLKNLVNLERLCLIDNDVLDISPLANLTKLEELELGDNPVTDICPLANIHSLKDLSVGSETFYFDDKDVEWLKQQLPNCDIDVWQMSNNGGGDSDEYFLKRVCWGKHYYRDNENVLERLEKIALKGDKDLEPLLTDALDNYYLHDMREQLQIMENKRLPALNNINPFLSSTCADELIRQLTFLAQDERYDDKKIL